MELKLVRNGKQLGQTVGVVLWTVDICHKTENLSQLFSNSRVNTKLNTAFQFTALCSGVWNTKAEVRRCLAITCSHLLPGTELNEQLKTAQQKMRRSCRGQGGAEMEQQMVDFGNYRTRYHRSQQRRCRDSSAVLGTSWDSFLWQIWHRLLVVDTICRTPGHAATRATRGG